MTENQDTEDISEDKILRLVHYLYEAPTDDGSPRKFREFTEGALRHASPSTIDEYKRRVAESMLLFYTEAAIDDILESLDANEHDELYVVAAEEIQRQMAHSHDDVKIGRWVPDVDAMMMTHATDDELLHRAMEQGAGCLSKEQIPRALSYFRDIMTAEPDAHRFTAVGHAIRVVRAESELHEWQICRGMWAKARAKQ